MSRPIAYNLPGAAINGSITNEDAVISYVVDGRGNDYFNNYESCTWVPSADGAAPIVFVTDTFTRGYEGDPNLAVPLFFACAGTSSAAILYTANRLPGSPGNYTNANTAIDELNRTYGYFILESNDPFQGDFQNGNLLTIDASKMTSYPQTGTNWYDMSGNGFSFSLVNGPSFQSSGWFNIDGTDDAIILTGNSALQSTNTLVVWLRTTGTTGLLLTGGGLNSTGPYYVAAYFPGQGFYSGTAGSPSYFMDTLATVDPATPINYLDGRFHMWEVKGLNFSGWTTTWNFFNYQAGYQIAGDVAKIQMFDSSLTSAQSKQLYFGSPIVTDGLVFAVDANNIVSYPKSGTAWYNLTGSFSGSLTNGPTFDPANGGAISFDGTDEYVTVQYNSALDISTAITVEAWVKYRSQGEIGGAGRTYSVISYKGYPWTWLLEDQSGQFNFRISTTSDSDSNIASNYYHGLNNWDHVVCTYNGATQAIYVNGILQNSKSLTGTIDTSATTIELGTYGTGDYSLNGWLANHRIYNRALSAAEIQQNYQAEQYRFETPAGPVTNGLVLYLDAGNLDSYPGTGTTWNDLSGNGNNATLYNGTSWNSLGYMSTDAVDDYIQIPNAASLQVTTGFTQVIWVKFNNIVTVSYKTLFGKPNLAQYGMIVEWYGGNPILFDFSVSGNRNALGLVYPGTSWVMVAQSYNSTGGANNQIGYIRGGATDTIYATRTGNVDTDTSPMNIGQAGLSMDVGMALVYNRGLTQTELDQIYNATKTRFGY